MGVRFRGKEIGFIFGENGVLVFYWMGLMVIMISTGHSSPSLSMVIMISTGHSSPSLSMVIMISTGHSSPSLSMVIMISTGHSSPSH